MNESWFVAIYKWSLRIAAIISIITAVFWFYKSGFKGNSLILILLAGFSLYYLSCFNLSQEERDLRYPINLITPKIFLFFVFSVFIYGATAFFWGHNIPGIVLAAFLFYISTRFFVQELDRWKKRKKRP